MAKKVSQTEMRQMMQKMKAEKAPSTSTDSRLKKYKLNSKEIALIEMEKKRKADEEIDKKKKFAKRAGVPETFFDSAKTKAFLNLQKAPQKSILKNSGSPSPSARNVPAASAKATGREWTSSEPILNKGAEKKEKSPKVKSPGAKEKSPRPALLRTPSGGAIGHDSEEDDSQDENTEDKTTSDTTVPEGFFDDPVEDAKARGIEYKDPEEEEWESWKKEIAVELTQSADILAEEQLGETVERQIEEIDEQMKAWTRVIEIEKKKDEVEEQFKIKKEVNDDAQDDAELGSDEEIDEGAIEDLFDWRKKKS